MAERKQAWVDFGFMPVHVQPRASDPLRLQSLDQGAFVDDDAAGCVDHIGGRLQKADASCVHQLMGFRIVRAVNGYDIGRLRSEEHTSELPSLMRISYAVFCLKT